MQALINFLARFINATKDAFNVQLSGSNVAETQVETDQDLTWANSASANTQKTYTFTKPTNPLSKYELIVYNPSTVSDLTVKIFAKELALKEDIRNGYITMFTVPKAQAFTGTTINTYVKTLEGIFNGTDCIVVVSNDTILGGSDGFIATIRLRELM